MHCTCAIFLHFTILLCHQLALQITWPGCLLSPTSTPPPFHSNASNYCFSSVALQYGFRRPCEFHHVFGVDSSYGSYPSLDVTWENRMLIFKLGCLVLFFFFFDPIASTIATTRSSKPGSVYLNDLEL